jgi:hypothetical protein
MKGSKFTSSLSFAHCWQQKEYYDFKVELFKDFGISYNKEHNYYDKRTNKMYKRYTCTTRSCVELKELRHFFYKEKKIIPIEYLYDNFDKTSLAFLYMDDGSSYKSNTIISTQSFDKKDLELFIKLLKDKFNLDFTIQKNNTIRIKQKDVQKFKDLIRFDVEKIQSMTYKL